MVISVAPPGMGGMMEDKPKDRLSSGIPGYDEILEGGLLPRRAHLVRGGPGSGKTVFGLHFLSAGAMKGETSLLITLAEPEHLIRENAASLGFTLDGVEILDLSPTSQFFTEVRAYDIFSPEEVEREPTTQRIVEKVDSLQPVRVFADSMTQFRYLATEPFQFRKQVLSFLRFLMERGSTVVFTSESSSVAPDDDLQFLADGVTTLDNSTDARTITVSKLRGSGYQRGRHALRITERGLQVFPRLLPQTHRREFPVETVSSGVPAIDEMLHGGIERGSITLISGPSGVGKTTFGSQFMKEAAGRGERSVVFAFDETKESFLTRSKRINIPVEPMIEQGNLAIVEVEPLRYTPDEFSSLVRDEVERRNARIVMLDSLAGIGISLRGEQLNIHLHAIGRYLKNMGVTMILVAEVEHITGEFRITDAKVSYLSDNVVFLRYLEVGGAIRKAIGVLKKRTGDFDKTLREFTITEYGVKVGEPLLKLRGMLRGVPEISGNAAPGKP